MAVCSVFNRQIRLVVDSKVFNSPELYSVNYCLVLPVYKDISFLVETCFFLSFLFIYISYYFLNYNFMCCAIIQMLNQLVFVDVPCVVVCFCLVHRHGIQLITYCIAHTFVSGWTSVGSLPDYSDSGLISFSFHIFLFAFH